MGNSNSDNMSLMEEFGQRKYEEGEQIGFEEGLEKRGWEIAENLLKKDVPLEFISEVTEIPIGRLKLFINNGK